MKENHIFFVKTAMLAKEKAETLAQTSGIRLGRLISVEESNFYHVPFDFAVSKAAGERLDIQILPEKVSISGSVSMRFEIA